ncbi:MAG: hypothetical protein AMJ75_03565 [Phycisphaerae bacterium SM1_79]|nr:MAG: hypothetical protein AMJ75_03565 [Phycisphaerae bacterium SM1_79]
MKKMVITSLLSLYFIFFTSSSSKGSFEPWDALTEDSWVGPGTINMYTANSEQIFTVRFNDAREDNIASGMKAFRFSLAADGNSVGHLYSNLLTSSFFVRNFSGIDGSVGNDYSTFLLLVAIDANGLAEDFFLAMDVNDPNYWDVVLDINDFIYYQHPEYDTGRPSGYYSVTEPNKEALGYLFDTSNFDYVFDVNSQRYSFESGMVSVIVFSNVNLLRGGGSVQVDYQFEHLTGPAVFSVYGYRSGLIKHTNRALADNNDPTAVVSTFEVVPVAGDFDGDGIVEADDLAFFCKYWLEEHCHNGKPCGLADFDDTGTVDFKDFAVFSSLWMKEYQQ